MRGRGHQRQVGGGVRVVGRQPDHLGHTHGRRPAPVDRTLGARHVRQAQRRRFRGAIRFRRQAHRRVGHPSWRRAHVVAAAPAHPRPVHVHRRDPRGRTPIREPVSTHHAANEHAGAVRQSAGVHQPG